MRYCSENHMRAKICGLTHLDDARYAIDQGAWALGFNFYPSSPRYIEPTAAAVIIRQLPGHIVKVGIVMGVNAGEAADLMNIVGLDLIQIYDDIEAPPSLKKRMILALQASTQDELPSHEILSQYAYVLLDSPKLADGLLGGTGRLSNWELAAQLAEKYRLLLAGGLTPTNVAAAIKAVRPYAVDVASGVQCSPGRVDRSLLQDFLRQVNHEQ